MFSPSSGDTGRVTSSVLLSRCPAGQLAAGMAQPSAPPPYDDKNPLYPPSAYPQPSHYGGGYPQPGGYPAPAGYVAPGGYGTPGGYPQPGMAMPTMPVRFGKLGSFVLRWGHGCWGAPRLSVPGRLSWCAVTWGELWCPSLAGDTYGGDGMGHSSPIQSADWDDRKVRHSFIRKVSLGCQGILHRGGGARLGGSRLSADCLPSPPTGLRHHLGAAAGDGGDHRDVHLCVSEVVMGVGGGSPRGLGGAFWCWAWGSACRPHTYPCHPTAHLCAPLSRGILLSTTPHSEYGVPVTLWVSVTPPTATESLGLSSLSLCSAVFLVTYLVLVCCQGPR